MNAAQAVARNGGTMLCPTCNGSGCGLVRHEEAMCCECGGTGVVLAGYDAPDFGDDDLGAELRDVAFVQPQAVDAYDRAQVAERARRTALGLSRRDAT